MLAAVWIAATRPAAAADFPAYYRLFDDVDLARSGTGFRAEPPTATFDGTLYVAEGRWPPTDWLLVPNDPKYQRPAGTYSGAWYVVKWREQSGINKNVDERGAGGPSLPPGHLDIQLGGSPHRNGARLHPRVNGTGRDEKGGWEGTYCQWVHVVMRWGQGQPVDFWINGRRRYSVPYSGGMEDNTADWVIGANRHIRKGRMGVSHPFGGAQFEPVMFVDRLSDAQVVQLYKAQFGHLPPSHHRPRVEGRSNGFGEKGKNYYRCKHDPAERLPKSLAETRFSGGAIAPAERRSAERQRAKPRPAPRRAAKSAPAQSQPVRSRPAVARLAAAEVRRPTPAAGLPRLAVRGPESAVAVFGHPFAPGDLPAGMTLALDGVPIQADVKATHADGSARHAILAARPGAGRLKAVPAGRCDPLAAARSLTGGGDRAAWRFRVAVDGRVADIAAMLRDGVDRNTLDVFLTCPLVSQYRVHRDLTPTLRVTADVTVYDDGRVRTDVMLDSAGLDTVDTQNLAVEIVQDGAVVYSRRQEQWRYTSWRHRVWRGRAMRAHPVRDAAYLVRTGATPRYDAAVVPDLDKTLDRHAEIAAGVQPMASPINFHKMGTTGQTAGDNIGPMTTDQVKYLLSQDPRALEVVEAYAFGAASIGWHWRDPVSGGVLRQTGGLTRKITRNGAWRVDQAHQPAFHYAAYLWTGDRWYLDLLHFQANSSLFDRRGNLLGGQVRAVAWKLRDVATAAYITPDGHPLKDYFAGHLDRALKRWKAEYVDSGAYDMLGEIRGFHWRARPRQRGKMSPWMEDYLTIVLAWMVEMGVSGAADGADPARAILAWKSNYTLGRFERHDGWSPYSGVSYLHGVADPETGKLTPAISRWGQLHKRDTKGVKNGRAHRAGHYFDVAFGAVKSVCNALPSARAGAAVDFMRRWAAEAGGGVFREWPRQPKWAIGVGSACTDAMGQGGAKKAG